MVEEGSRGEVAKGEVKCSESRFDFKTFGLEFQFRFSGIHGCACNCRELTRMSSLNRPKRYHRLLLMLACNSNSAND